MDTEIKFEYKDPENQRNQWCWKLKGERKALMSFLDGKKVCQLKVRKSEFTLLPSYQMLSTDSVPSSFKN